MDATHGHDDICNRAIKQGWKNSTPKVVKDDTKTDKDLCEQIVQAGKMQQKMQQSPYKEAYPGLPPAPYLRGDLTDERECGKEIKRTYTLLTKQDCLDSDHITKTEDGKLPTSMTFVADSDGNGGLESYYHLRPKPGDGFPHHCYPQATFFEKTFFRKADKLVHEWECIRKGQLDDFLAMKMTNFPFPPSSSLKKLNEKISDHNDLCKKKKKLPTVEEDGEAEGDAGDDDDEDEDEDDEQDLENTEDFDPVAENLHNTKQNQTLAQQKKGDAKKEKKNKKKANKEQRLNHREGTATIKLPPEEIVNGRLEKVGESIAQGRRTEDDLRAAGEDKRAETMNETILDAEACRCFAPTGTQTVEDMTLKQWKPMGQRVDKLNVNIEEPNRKIICKKYLKLNHIAQNYDASFMSLADSKIDGSNFDKFSVEIPQVSACGGDADELTAMRHEHLQNMCVKAAKAPVVASSLKGSPVDKVVQAGLSHVV